MKLIFPKLCYKVIGAAYEVYNRLGPCFREIIYQKALEIELEEKGISFQSQVPIELTYRGRPLANGKLDILVEEKLILELKAVDTIHPNHVSQTIQYLATLNLRLGLIINFGNPGKLQFKRVPYGKDS